MDEKSRIGSYPAKGKVVVRSNVVFRIIPESEQNFVACSDETDFSFEVAPVNASSGVIKYVTYGHMCY